jgi:hypothetical protein
VDTRRFFYPVMQLDADGEVGKLAGTAFPVAPNAGLLTCRHVVEKVDDVGKDIQPVVWDRVAGQGWPIQRAFFPKDARLDLAFLPNALPGERAEFLPFLEPNEILTGMRVFSCGYFAAAGWPHNLRRIGWLSGEIVAVEREHPNVGPRESLLLPYAVIEGVSGAPVIARDRNGAKVVGVNVGNESQRTLAYEVIESREGEAHHQETAHRVVEFGLAYHAAPVLDFLNELADEGHLLAPSVSSAAAATPNLE